MTEQVPVPEQAFNQPANELGLLAKAVENNHCPARIACVASSGLYPRSVYAIDLMKIVGDRAITSTDQ